MVDMHSHVIYGIDDGARTIEESIEMLRMWEEQSVQTVFATQHFDVLKDNLDDFLENTRNNHSYMMESARDHGLNIEVKFGAELLYRQELVHYNLSDLVLEGTNYLLIEFPTTVMPIGIVETFNALMDQGYNIILAHVERYFFLKNNLELFHELLEMGVVMQMNAERIIQGLDKFYQLALERNYIHLIASDAHRADKRKPNVDEAYRLISKDFREKFHYNGQLIRENGFIDTTVDKKIKKIVSFYF